MKNRNMMVNGKAINKEIVSNMEWKKGTPTEEKQYLVCWGKYREVRILTWNPHYNVWDDEEGDDFFCEPNMVSHWMELPVPPQED